MHNLNHTLGTNAHLHIFMQYTLEHVNISSWIYFQKKIHLHFTESKYDQLRDKTFTGSGGGGCYIISKPYLWNSRKWSYNLQDGICVNPHLAVQDLGKFCFEVLTRVRPRNLVFFLHSLSVFFSVPPNSSTFFISLPFFSSSFLQPVEAMKLINPPNPPCSQNINY